MTLRLTLFRQLALHDGARAIALSPSTAPLLAYLGLHATRGRSVTRSRLAAVLAPEADEEQARRVLSRRLYQLRRDVRGAGDPGPWLIAADSVALGAVWVDVDAFADLAEAGEREGWAAALGLYSGDLLEDLDADWLEAPRALLRERYLATAERLVAALEPDQPEAALPYALRLAADDPLHERASALLMQLQARLGRYGAALQQYERLARLLDAELGVPPLPETRALAATIRAEHQARALAPGRVPLVGRAPEYARLLALLERAQAGRGGLAVVLGEAGVGKTRLLEELAEAAGWRGWQVAWGRAEEYAIPQPFAPLTQALAAALPPPRLQQLADRGVSPYWLAQVGRLLSGRAGRAAPDEGPDAEGAAQLPEAIAHALAGAQRLAPLLLILDDVQWGDPALWPLLDGLREPAGALAVALVVCGRRAELAQAQQAARLMRGWEQHGAPVLALGSLDAPALHELAAVYTGAAPPADRLAQLSRASGGNPLVALALLQADPLIGSGAPPSLAQVLQGRLDALTPEARRSLAAAAALGYHVDYALWGDVAAAEVLAQSAHELERSGLLVLEAGGYRFAHDTLRAYVYEALDDDERRALHLRALAALEARAPADVLALLYHAQRAGRAEQVARYALLAGERAIGQFAFAAAAGLFEQALPALPPDDLARRYEATRGLARALDVVADRERQRAALDALELLAGRRADVGAQAEAAHLRALYERGVGAFEAARASAQRGLALAERAGDQGRQAALLLVLGETARDQGEHRQAGGWVERARALYRDRRDRAGEALATNLLGSIAYDLGDYPASAGHHRAAADAFRRGGDPLREARALNNLGSALWGCGDYVGARETHERAVALCRELDDQRGEGDNLDNLGGVAWVLGEYASAIDHYLRALSIREATHDTWGISISLSNLGDAHRERGEPDAALAYYERSLQVCRAMGRRRGEAFALHGRGLTLLAAGRYAEAAAALEASRQIRAELGERDTLAETEAALALGAHLAGDGAGARALSEAARARLLDHDRPALRQWVWYVAYRVAPPDAALPALRQAQAAMHAAAAALPPVARASYLEQVPLNRAVRAALQSLSRRAQARLARADVPLGRPLAEADYVLVEWTVEAPDDEAIGRPADRRRFVLRRLLAEAQSQGAAPTDADLARALAVSVRTVERDMLALRAAGRTPPTRRRRD